MHLKDMFIIICIALLFSVGIIGSIWGLRLIEEDILSSILPELFGFFLEGIILVLIFKYFENRRTIQSNKQLKNNLKKSLTSFLSVYISWGNQTDSSEFQNLNELFDIDCAIATISDELESGATENFSSFHTVDFAKSQMTEIVSLLPIAAQIGPKHLFQWSLIYLSLSNLAKNDRHKRESLKRLKQVLINVQQFVEIDVEHDK